MECKSIHISSSKFSVYFARKSLLFLFYKSTFTKHLHQFIYSTHLFNKIFIILLIFIIHSLTVPLSHRPTATITTIIRNQRKIRSTHTYRSTHISINPHEKSNSTSDQPTSINPHKEKLTPIKTPLSPCIHTSTPPHIPRSTQSTQTHSHHHHQQPSAINLINPDPHTQINLDQPDQTIPRSTQTKQTHTNQDRPTP